MTTNRKRTGRHEGVMLPWARSRESHLESLARHGVLGHALHHDGRHVRDDYEERYLRTLRAQLWIDDEAGVSR